MAAVTATEIRASATINMPTSAGNNELLYHTVTLLIALTCSPIPFRRQFSVFQKFKVYL